MGAPDWLKPAIAGGIVGAIATMVLGFNQGGWWLDSSAERMAEQRASLAVTEALVPVCIGQSKTDPEAGAKLEQFGAIASPYERRTFVMESGWATMPMAEAPNSDLAEACAKELKAQQT
jgi:hypothetical protein